MTDINYPEKSLSIKDSSSNKIKSLMNKAGASSEIQLINHALSLLELIYEEEEAGKEIVSYSEKKNSIQPLRTRIKNGK